MANTITSVTPKLLAQGLMALREVSIMPRLVNRRYEALAGERGSTIDVPIPSAITAVAVSPAATPPSTADVAPTSVPIALDQWFEAPFYLTDKEQMEVMEGMIPMQASEAVKAVSNKMDQYILDQFIGVYGFVNEAAAGAANRTPFTDSAGAPTNTQILTSARTTLNKQLAPFDNRHVVMNPDAEGAALDLRAFQDASYSGNVQAIIDGDLNRKMGFQIWMDQNIDGATTKHVAGTASTDADVIAVDNGAGYAIGIKSMNVDVAAGTSTFVIGDVFTIAGVNGTFVATNAGTFDVTGVTLTFEPGLPVAVADNDALTFEESHTNNLAFHRDAFAFATRPLDQATEGLGAISMSNVDPMTGLALRIEVTREHKRTRFSYDMLWGAALVRAALCVRMAGAA